MKSPRSVCSIFWTTYSEPKSRGPTKNWASFFWAPSSSSFNSSSFTWRAEASSTSSFTCFASRSASICRTHRIQARPFPRASFSKTRRTRCPCCIRSWRRLLSFCRRRRPEEASATERVAMRPVSVRKTKSPNSRKVS